MNNKEEVIEYLADQDITALTYFSGVIEGMIAKETQGREDEGAD
jgi:hypothetical protein